MSAAQERDQAARERFLNDTREHKMTVLRDDGLYRHLRFRTPGSSFYWYDLVTWPGRLVVCGDAGDWMFARTEDMFEFFECHSGGINPHYWGEKLRPGGRESAKTYDEDLFRKVVLEWYEQQALELYSDEQRATLREAIDEQLLGEYVEHNHYEDGARRLLAEFEHVAQVGPERRTLTITDSYDYELRDYDWSFLWCCWAIVEGIKQYRAQAEEVADVA